MVQAGSAEMGTAKLASACKPSVPHQLERCTGRLNRWGEGRGRQGTGVGGLAAVRQQSAPLSPLPIRTPPPPRDPSPCSTHTHCNMDHLAPWQRPCQSYSEGYNKGYGQPVLDGKVPARQLLEGQRGRKGEGLEQLTRGCMGKEQSRAWLQARLFLLHTHTHTPDIRPGFAQAGSHAVPAPCVPECPAPSTFCAFPSCSQLPRLLFSLRRSQLHLAALAGCSDYTILHPPGRARGPAETRNARQGKSFLRSKGALPVKRTGLYSHACFNEYLARICSDAVGWLTSVQAYMGVTPLIDA